MKLSKMGTFSQLTLVQSCKIKKYSMQFSNHSSRAPDLKLIFTPQQRCNRRFFRVADVNYVFKHVLSGFDTLSKCQSGLIRVIGL